MAQVVQGAVRLRRGLGGADTVEVAPPRARITLAELTDRQWLSVEATGNTVTFAGQVVYRVTGWDPVGSALLAELYEDRRHT